MSRPNDTPELDFVLSQASGRPMYMQIIEQVQHRVAVGDWGPGTRMPSIRELAVAIGVSVITVKRAYLELEREGVIVTQQGKGSWISENESRGRLQQEELERHLARAAELGRAMGLTAEQLRAELERFTQGEGAE